MYFVAILIVPVLTFFLLEILFTASYFFSKSKYFENKNENYNQRNILPYEILEIKEDFFPNNKPIKVAIFGGSSAAGWGTAISFAQFIKNSILSDKNIIVHNYAKPAEPFVDFQAEILKAVISHYDVLIIYAGHNEYLGKIYSSVKNSSEPKILPNNKSIKNGNEKYKVINKRIKDFTEYGFQGYLSPNKMSLNLIAERSRVYWFTYRALMKTNSIVKKLYNNDSLNNNTKLYEEKYEFKHYYPNYFFSPDERQSIVDDYKETIIDIIKILSPDQKLIVSTVLSNNLFPPHANVLNLNDIEKIENYEKYAINSYRALLEEDYQSLEILLNNLPMGSHKTYLKARSCLGLVWKNKLKNSDCIKLLKKAKILDDYPVQIVPEINTFIRELKFNNVFIIDPVEVLNNSDNFNDYNNYFIDFQHPSALGHYVIANEILSKLFDDYNEPTFFSLDVCDNFTIQKKYKKFILKPNNFHHYWSIRDNVKWLDDFTSMYSSEYYQYFLNYFKQRTINKTNRCDIKY